MRTFEQFRNNSLFFTPKTAGSHFPDANMTLSNLLQSRPGKTSPCYVIVEDEEPIDNSSCQQTVKSSRADHVMLSGRNLNNINEQECMAKQDMDACLTCVSNKLTSVSYDSVNPHDRTGHRNYSAPLTNGSAETSDRLAACRRKLSQLSRPTKSEISSLSSASSSSSSSSSSSPSTSDRGDESPMDERDFQPEESARINNRNHSEIKSGHLVLISTDHGTNAVSPVSKAASRATSPSRYPVLVKIHKKSYERYAIISRTRRHPAMPSFYLRLKNSKVMPSLSNPSHFVVVVDGSEARTFHFEASNPELAKEWIQAFSTDNFSHRKSSLNHKPVLSTIDLSDNQRDTTQTHLLVPAQDSTFHSPQMKIPRSPLMPVLSETSEDLEECEE